MNELKISQLINLLELLKLDLEHMKEEFDQSQVTLQSFTFNPLHALDGAILQVEQIITASTNDLKLGKGEDDEGCTMRAN